MTIWEKLIGALIPLAAVALFCRLFIGNVWRDTHELKLGPRLWREEKR